MRIQTRSLLYLVVAGFFPLAIINIYIFLRGKTGLLGQSGFLALIFAELLLALILAYFLSRDIAQPIKRLVRGVRMVGSGALNYVPGISSQDEVKELTDSFNQMVGDLRAEREAVGKFLLVLENIGEMVLFLDREGKVQYANRAALNTLGFDISQLRGKRFFDLKGEASLLEESFHQLTENVRPWQGEITLLGADAKPIPVLVSLVPVRDAAGALLGIALSARDLSEVRKLHEKLLRSEALANIGQLAGSVAHELRNPLSVIQNAVYYLRLLLGKKSALDPKVERYLNMLGEEVSACDGILSSLLNFSQRRELRLFRVSPPQVLREVLEKRPLPAAIRLEVDLPEEDTFYVDVEQMRQVFGNLIQNALQAMPSGGLLRISGRREGGYWRIDFSDSGGGVDPEVEQKIFDPLFTTKSKGTGLGLAICKKIVEDHGGTIELLNRPNEGATFTISIPAKVEVAEKGGLR